MTEQKQPQKDEYWFPQTGKPYLCIATNNAGETVWQKHHGAFMIFSDNFYWKNWHHEPRCDSFEWTPPPAIDPGEGWELLPKRVILQKEDQCLGVDGNWRNTIYAGEEGSDLNTYRRRRKPAEWPKYYVPSDPLRKTGHGKHVAYYQKNIHGDGITVHVDGTDFMWKYGGMEYLGIETTKAEALARVNAKPAHELCSMCGMFPVMPGTAGCRECTAYAIEATRCPVESPDDWVEITDERHVIREAIDQVNWIGNSSAGWSYATASVGTKIKDNKFLKFRCRRRDLPVAELTPFQQKMKAIGEREREMKAAAPKRIPVRLFKADDCKDVFAVQGEWPIVAGCKQIKWDAGGFYVEDLHGRSQ